MIARRCHGFDMIARDRYKAINHRGPRMPDLTLYHASPSRSSIVLWMLEELGEPYDIKLIKLSAGDNMKPDYLAINPMGKVPALNHGDTVITEVAAICTYLADEFPGRQAECADRHAAPRRLSQMAVLRARLPGAGGDRPRRPAQGTGAPRHARLRRFRHQHERGGQGGGKGAVADGRAIHRRRRGDRRQYPLGHDVQDDAGAEGISDYAARIAARPAAQRAEAKDKELAAADEAAAQARPSSGIFSSLPQALQCTASTSCRSRPHCGQR